MEVCIPDRPDVLTNQGENIPSFLISSPSLKFTIFLYLSQYILPPPFNEKFERSETEFFKNLLHQRMPEECEIYSLQLREQRYLETIREGKERNNFFKCLSE